MSLESINFQPLARFQRKKYRLFKKNQSFLNTKTFPFMNRFSLVYRKFLRKKM